MLKASLFLYVLNVHYYNKIALRNKEINAKTWQEIVKMPKCVIILIEVSTDSKIKYKELYLDPKTLNPTKLLIQDNDKNEIIYILYNEIELNY